MSSFVDDVLSGKAKLEDIDDYIETWHNSELNLAPLRVFLGFTKKDYKEWLENPDSLKIIISRHKKG